MRGHAVHLAWKWPILCRVIYRVATHTASCKYCRDAAHGLLAAHQVGGTAVHGSCCRSDSVGGGPVGRYKAEHLQVLTGPYHLQGDPINPGNGPLPLPADHPMRASYHLTHPDDQQMGWLSELGAEIWDSATGVGQLTPRHRPSQVRDHYEVMGLPHWVLRE